MKTVLIACIGSIVALQSAHANVVINGGFEAPINSANGWTTNTSFIQRSALGTITPRTGSSFATVLTTSNTPRTDTMTQVLALSAGNVVDFNLYYQLLSSSATASVTVTLDGNVIYTATPGAANILTWTNVSVPSITIMNNNPTLRISQTMSNRSSTFCFDDVSVTVVPAPAGAGLAAASLLFAGRRRRRSN